MVLATIQIAYAIDECKPVMSIEEADNCTVTTTWDYPNSCDSYQANVYNSNGTYLQNTNLTDFGQSHYCFFYWNLSNAGSYYYNISSGDSGSIIVEAENLIQNIIIGIGIIAGLLFWFASKLEKEHFILKLLLIISSITMLTLIPATIMTNGSTDITFYRFMLYIFVAFWLYVAGYFVYWLLKYMGYIVSGTNEQRYR